MLFSARHSGQYHIFWGPALGNFIARDIELPRDPSFCFQLHFRARASATAIRPHEINGHRVAHPPEFFEREQQLSPEREEAKRWIFKTLGKRLRVRPRLERIDVLRG